MKEKQGLRRFNLSKFGTILLHRLALIFYILCAALPLYWLIVTSFKSQSEIYQKIPTVWPARFTLENYATVLTNKNFLTSVKNSLIVSLSVVFISIMVSFPVAYSLSRKEFPGKRLYSKVILFSYLLPSSMMYLPLYIVSSRLGLTNKIGALVFLYPAFTLPYCCWVLIPHVGAVPTSIEEAAIMDGCTSLGVMYRIVFRLSLAGIASTAIFCFSMCWGEYLYALVNITSDANKTIPLVISEMIFGDMFPWGEIMASGVLACIPVFILYMISSRFLAGDSTAGGVKG